MVDHIYTNDTTSMTNINSNTPLMGDHKIITATLGDTKPTPKITEKWNWKNYSKSLLIESLNDVIFDLEISTVQDLANDIENKIIGVVDNLVPICKFNNNRLEKTTTHPDLLKRKINQRKKLLKKLKQDRTQDTKIHIKNLSIEIKYHFANETKSKVRQGIKPGNKQKLILSITIPVIMQL